LGVPAKLWLQFAGLLLGLQWILGALLLPLAALAAVYPWAAMGAALVLLALVWRIGLVFRGECARLKVKGLLRGAEALLAGLLLAAPAGLAAWAAVADSAWLRWLAGPAVPGVQAAMALAGVTMPGPYVALGAALVCLLLFWVPAGLLPAPDPEPVIKTKPVALAPAPKVATAEAAATREEPAQTWKPAKRYKDVVGRGKPGRLPPSENE
jgi:hypothetical protein